MVACSSTCIVVGRRVFYIFNLGIPVFLAYTGAAGLKELTSYTQTSTATVFQCVYMLLFAALLFIFEAVQICPCEMFDNILKRNFGFFYGVFGKGIETDFCIPIIVNQSQPFLLSNSYLIALCCNRYSRMQIYHSFLHSYDWNIRLWVGFSSAVIYRMRYHCCSLRSLLCPGPFSCKLLLSN